MGKKCVAGGGRRRGWSSLDSRKMVPTDPRDASEVGQRSSGPLHRRGTVWRDARAQISKPIQRKWQRGKSGQEVQVATRHRVERLEKALSARQGRSRRGLSAALKETRRATQSRPLAVQITQCQAFAFSEPHSADGGGMRGGAEEIGRRSRSPLTIARGDGQNPRCSSERSHSNINATHIFPSRRSVCRDPSVESADGRSGIGTRHSGEASPFVVRPFPQADQSLSVLRFPDSRSTLMQTNIDQGSSLAASNNRFSPLGP